MSYDGWIRPFEDWLKKTEDLPDPRQIIDIADETGREWLVLATYPAWEEPIGMGQDKSHYRYEYFWYQIRSYLIHTPESEKLIKWCSKQHFMGRWMPEESTRYELFSREYYWSPAYRFFRRPWYEGEVWRSVRGEGDAGSIGEVMATVENYFWEREYDCSKDETISFLKPCESIFTGLNMRFGRDEGSLVNEDGVVICLDPSVSAQGPICLLVRKHELVEFLRAHDLRIFWTLLGEKLIAGDAFGPRPAYDRLEFSGVYALTDDHVRGDLTFYRPW